MGALTLVLSKFENLLSQVWVNEAANPSVPEKYQGIPSI
jgi:hypothetical protein